MKFPALPLLLGAGAVACILQACSSDDGAPAPPTSSPDTPGADAAASAGDGASLQSQLDASPAPGPDAAPAEPAVLFLGRFDTSDPAKPRVGWPGARILARFDGTSVSAKFDETFGETNEGSRWDVAIDGTWQTDPLVLDEGASTYPLATELPPGLHTLELWRRSEGRIGTSTFEGFDFGPGGKLLPPPARASRRLEVLGDSASAGYGIDGDGPNCPFGSATENEHETYPALLVTSLSLEHQNLSYSGKGVYWNYDRSDPDVYDQLYARSVPTDPTSTWSFADFEPDVVWIMLGGNDWDIPTTGAPPPPQADFEAEYDALVTTVRAKHPAAHVFFAIAPSLNDDYPVGYDAFSNMKTTLDDVVAKRSDAKLHVVVFDRADHDNDLTGCDYHPSKGLHQKMAVQAAAAIKAATGWQ